MICYKCGEGFAAYRNNPIFCLACLIEMFKICQPHGHYHLDMFEADIENECRATRHKSPWTGAALTRRK